MVAVIGDGALTGGLAYEGLNNAGRMHRNLIVILNDNTMSISKTWAPCAVPQLHPHQARLYQDEKPPGELLAEAPRGGPCHRHVAAQVETAGETPVLQHHHL